MPALNGDPSGFSAVPNAEFGPRARLRARSETEGLRPDSCCELSVHPAGACLHGLVNLSLSNGVSSLGQPNRRQRKVPATARLMFCGGNVYHTAHQNVDCVRVATVQYTHLFEGTAVKCECAYTWFSIRSWSTVLKIAHVSWCGTRRASPLLHKITGLVTRRHFTISFIAMNKIVLVWRS